MNQLAQSKVLILYNGTRLVHLNPLRQMVKQRLPWAVGNDLMRLQGCSAFDSAVEALQSQDPSSDPAGCLFCAEHPSERCMIAVDLKMGEFYVRAKLVQSPDHCEVFKLLNSVVSFSVIQSSANEGDWPELTIVFLQEHSGDADGIRLDDKRAVEVGQTNHCFFF